MDTGRYYIMKNLINTGTGYYLSLNDPGIYEKIRHSPYVNGKMLYTAALALEKQADIYLADFRKTRSRHSYSNYRKKLQESLSMMRKSWKNGFVYAGKDILRIDRRLTGTLYSGSSLLTKIIDLATLLFLCFIAGLIIPFVVYLLIR